LKAEAAPLIKSLVVKLKFHDFKQTTLESSATRVPTLEVFAAMLSAAFGRGQKPVRLIGIGARMMTVKGRAVQQNGGLAGGEVSAQLELL
jgi:hypothetical protein